MSRNFAWQNRIGTNHVTKQRGKITVPAFSAACGGPRSFFINANYILCTDSGAAFTTAFTIKFWLYLEQDPTAGEIQPILTNTNTAVFYANDLGIGVINKRITLATNGINPATIFSGATLPVGQWVYVAITYDNANIRIYLGNILDSIHAFVGPFNTGAGQYKIGDDRAASPAALTYYLSSFEAYNRVITQAEIDFYQYRMAHSALNGLLLQFYFTESNAIGIYHNNVTNNTFAPVDGMAVIDSFPHSNLYGASFIAALFDVTTTYSESFKVPVQAPTSDCNFVLAVSYIDTLDTGDTIRYYFWSVDGITIPNATLYTGQVLSKNFTLEVWNKDGNATVDLAEDLVLYTSSRRVVTETDYQTINADETITIDTTIGTTYPLNYPEIYNTIPTY